MCLDRLIRPIPEVKQGYKVVVRAPGSDSYRSFFQGHRLDIGESYIAHEEYELPDLYTLKSEPYTCGYHSYVKLEDAFKAMAILASRYNDMGTLCVLLVEVDGILDYGMEPIGEVVVSNVIKVIKVIESTK